MADVWKIVIAHHVNNATKHRLSITAGLTAALFGGWMIAHGELAGPAVAFGAIGLLALSRLSAVAADAAAAGLLIVGYFVGNRGFAQLMIPGIPLLPAEFVLGLGLGVRCWQVARQKHVPIATNSLTVFLLIWMALGFVRAPLDFRAFGFVALRDFAMVYYATFFFLAQIWITEEPERKWMIGCALSGLALCTPMFGMFGIWPDFFTDHLTFRGAPIIYIKSDVAGGFMAAATLVFFLKFARRQGWTWYLLGVISLAGVAYSNSRAALVALAVGVLWMAVLRQTRACLAILGAGILGLILLGGVAALSPRPWSQSTVYQLYESALSVTDLYGTRAYRNLSLGDKPDNNRFRREWWRAVVSETSEVAPVFGQGFGADLADRFVREYGGVDPEMFSARSPHSFIVTVYGRMGVAGLLALSCFVAAMFIHTWRSREREGDALGMWLAAWAILVSACFGVVLESPMGAVVFWTLLGLAASAPARNVPEPMQASAANRDRPLIQV